jgi:hypothetical protein
LDWSQRDDQRRERLLSREVEFRQEVYNSLPDAPYDV